jgi:hypothetical protein
MKAKYINEAGFGNSQYRDRSDPHGAFDKARDILLNEIGNHISEDILAEPTLLVPNSLNDLISVDTHSDDPRGDLWKNSFMENYVGPIIDALEIIQKKTKALKTMEGLGSMDFISTKKPKLIDKIKNIVPK